MGLRDLHAVSDDRSFVATTPWLVASGSKICGSDANAPNLYLELKEHYKVTVTLRSICIALGIALVGFGAAGMLICFVFLWSSDFRDIAGAGLGFVAGSVMIGAGSISLALCSIGETAQRTATFGHADA
jgi:hypothetical protein